jgi:drug/metabolite transporter (DMT)-like permease
LKQSDVASSAEAKPVAKPVRPIDLLAVIGLTGCCAAWGLNQVAVKVANTGMSPLFQAGLRCALAALLLVAWTVWRGIPLFKSDGSFWPGVTVGAMLAGNFMFMGPGLDMTDTSRGVLFLYATPLMVAMGAHILIPGERLTALKIVGLIAAFAGLALSTVSRPAVGAAPYQTLGDFYCFVAAVFWATSTLVVRTTCLKTISPEKILFYQLVVSPPLLFLGAWLLGESGIGVLTPRVLMAFAFSTVAVVFISYVVWFWLLHTYPAAEVSVFTFLAPIFGVFAGYVLLQEPVGWTLVGALILVVIGIGLVAKPVRSAHDVNVLEVK